MGDYQGPSVREELSKINQALNSLSSSGGVGRAKRSKSHASVNDTVDGVEITNGKKDFGDPRHVDKCANAQGPKDEVVPPLDGHNIRNVDSYLDDEEFLNELIRNAGDVEHVKKLIGRHRTEDLKEVMTDLMKGLKEAVAKDNDSAIRDKEVWFC